MVIGNQYFHLSLQSPEIICQQDKAAATAVSARSILGPKAAPLAKGKLRNKFNSSGENPPSGPIRTAALEAGFSFKTEKNLGSFGFHP